MTARASAYGADSLPAEETGLPRRFTIEVYERERAETTLREALAREAALIEALARNEAMVRQLNEAAFRLVAWREAAAARIACLTPREYEVMGLVLAGIPSKNIAADLGISQRTVENHRAEIMRRTGTKCVASLARLALAAAWIDIPEIGS
jgi:FixJ family two-component response regulator